MTFFNGSDSVEMATLMARTTKTIDTPTPIIRALAEREDFWKTVQPIVDSGADPLDLQVALVEAVESMRPGLKESFSMHAIYASASRVINSGSAKMAEKHGLDAIHKLVGGKVKVLQLEAKPQQNF